MSRQPQTGGAPRAAVAPAENAAPREAAALCESAALCETGAPHAFVYMVRCADGTLYSGWTTDVAARVAAHNAGRGAKYTRSRLPVCLCYAERCVDKPAALRREHALKRLTRAEKSALCAAWMPEKR